MIESGPRWMKVATPLVTARVGQLVQNDISTCLVFQSEYREGTRNKVFTGLGGNTVAAVGRRKFPFALAFTAERGDIHHLSGTIESWELLGDGPFLFPIDAQDQVRSDQGYGKEPCLDRKQAWFLPPNDERCQDGTDADFCGGFRFPE